MDLASKEGEYLSGFVRNSPDKNVLPANCTGNEADCISQDLITCGNYTGNEVNYVSLDLISVGNQTGNETNCVSLDLIADENHTGNEANYVSVDLIADGKHTANEADCISSDLIANGNYTGNEVNWMPSDLFTSEDYIRNKGKDENDGNELIKGHQSMMVFLGQFNEWRTLCTEFLPVDCYDGWNSQMLSALPLINPNDDLYDDTVRCHNASSGIGENRIGTGNHNPVTHANPVFNESVDSSGRAILNYRYTQDEAICPKDLLGGGHWIQNDGFDYNENLTLAFEDPLKDGTIFKDVAVKIRKGEIADNKSLMCPVRSNKRNPVSVDSTGFIFVSNCLEFFVNRIRMRYFPKHWKERKRFENDTPSSLTL